MAPLTTTNPLTTTKVAGISNKGLYGRSKSGSRNRKTMAPRVVRKKNEYSPSPLNVRRARKFPKSMYSAEKMVDKRRALRGASDVSGLGGLDESVSGSGLARNRPTRARKPGSQVLFAAATVIRPATKELPSREPATTRQTIIAATMPPAGPISRVMAVFLI
jgi:hypothetical protein